jgi:hypothetical protein
MPELDQPDAYLSPAMVRMSGPFLEKGAAQAAPFLNASAAIEYSWTYAVPERRCKPHESRRQGKVR